MKKSNRETEYGESTTRPPIVVLKEIKEALGHQLSIHDMLMLLCEELTLGLAMETLVRRFDFRFCQLCSSPLERGGWLICGACKGQLTQLKSSRYMTEPEHAELKSSLSITEPEHAAVVTSLKRRIDDLEAFLRNEGVEVQCFKDRIRELEAQIVSERAEMQRIANEAIEATIGEPKGDNQ